MADPIYQKENRAKILEDYKGEKSRSLIRLCTAYDRYTEAINLMETLKDVKDMRILDYGCGAADYGLYFSRRGAKLSFLDCATMIDFVRYRMELEGFKGNYFYVGYDILDFKNYDFIIFSEVLEHLVSPLRVIKDCYESKVKYLFTTAYPFVTDMNYFLHKGHSKKAGDEQGEVKAFLESHYDKLAHYTGGQYLWKLKKT